MSLYIPHSFVVEKRELAEKLVQEHPFATLVTATPDGLHVSHLPLFLESGLLMGHLARGNPHSKVLAKHPSTVIFHGPHAYVTPTWYAECDVPTWNYVTLHVSGQARLVEKEDLLIDCLRKLTERMEAKGGWDFQIPADLSGNLTKAIVGFEIPMGKWEMKAKLSQNRSPEDREGVLRGLATRTDEGSRGVREWMRRL